jgi:hypothetical protein
MLSGGLGFGHLIGVAGALESLLVLDGPIGPGTLWHGALLVAGLAIGFVERFTQVWTRIEIGLAAQRIPLVEWSGHGVRSLTLRLQHAKWRGSNWGREVRHPAQMITSWS